MGFRSEFRQSAVTLSDQVCATSRAITVRELATLLHVSERLIYRMAADGVIPSLKICGSVRFDPYATAQWLRRTMSTPSSTQRDAPNCGVFERMQENKMPLGLPKKETSDAQTKR
jgi:excisionase family DNA binding protein